MLLGMQFLRQYMALAIGLTVFRSLLPVVGSTFAQQTPYGAKVATRSATVRSGPGAEFYATDRLPFETRIEVYRHDGEWAAIRPPRGSFSWVPSSAVELTEQTSVGYVVATGIRTRIGSNFGDDHTAEYVELKPDEEVAILARRTLDEDGVPTRWYQIEPPPGEFRWVQLASIEPIQSPFAAVTPSPADPVNDSNDDPGNAPDSSEPIGPTEAHRSSVLVTSDIDSTHPPPDGPVQLAQHFDAPEQFEPEQFEPVPKDAVPKDAVPKDAVPVGLVTREADALASDLEVDFGLGFDQDTDTELDLDFGADIESNLDTNTEPNGRPQGVARPQSAPPRWSAPSLVTDKPPFRWIGSIGSITSTPTPAASKGVDQNVLRQELARITLELTREVVQPPNVWELVEFRARAQAVIDLSSSTKLRSESQALLSHIAQFEDIQRRSADLATTFSNSFLDRSDLSGADTSAYRSATGLSIKTARPPKSAEALSHSKSSEVAYDGSGWLMPVVTRQVGVPRYALTDDHGNILQFVSPRPGLNLRNYEKRRIAILGSKGFIPRYNKPHLTAERIISLDRVRF